MKPLESIFHRFVELHPDDAARAFETLQSDDALRTFKSLTTAAATALLERLSPPVAAPILQQLDIERLRELLSRMPPRAIRWSRSSTATC
jgi:Mg/Co/Ni transporter MgtE